MFTLFKTLLAPWHRDAWEDTSDDVIAEFFKRLVFGLITRILGGIIRLTTIILGILGILVIIILLPIFLILPIRIRYENLVKFGSIGKSWSYGHVPTLRKYGRILYLTPEVTLIEKESQIREMERVLSRERQDNVLLVGYPGTGKTTLIQQFAKRIHWGLTLPAIQNRKMVELFVDGLSVEMARRSLKEAVKAGNIIIVIEDIHKYPELIEILTPYLEAQEFQIIATTDFANYHGFLKERSDVTRLFEKVELYPPSKEGVVKILKEYIQKTNAVRKRRNQIHAEESVLGIIVNLTDQYIQNVPQPEKSIDLIEELAVTDRNFTKDAVLQILSEKINIPLGQLQKSEKEILLNLETILSRKIIGQKEAVNEISEAMRRARAGVGSKKRPIGTFLFLGPTGVGKTHTAKMLAGAYFGNEEAMIRFDMSEFQEENTISRLMTRMIDAIEENPLSLLFLDEIEKAHPDILNLFLQVLDEGRLTSMSGRTASFRNAIIIATSNAGGIAIQQNPNIQKDTLLQDLIASAIFRPEFVNRFDGVILFHPLSKENTRKIVELMFSDFNKEIQKDKGITIKPSIPLLEYLAEIGHDVRFGARAIRRAMQDVVQNQVADKILRDEVGPGGIVEIEIPSK